MERRESEEPSPMRLLLAIYFEGEEARVFGLEEDKARKALADEETTVPMG